MSATVDIALARLLGFPDDELYTEFAEVTSALQEAPAGVRESSELFLSEIASLDALEREAVYVETFDFDRRASLHLTSHTHGDRRQRGARLVGIKRLLRSVGLEPTDGELPDHLAVLLELRALAPSDGADVLREFRPAFELVRSRLHETGSPYRHVLDAIAATLPRATRAEREAAARLVSDGPPGELVGLEPFAPAEVMPVSGGVR